MPPPGPTVLDRLVDAGRTVFAVGKIQDIFDHRGISDAVYSVSNEDGIDRTIDALGRGSGDLVFTNLVDFDSKYGHRNDVAGYGRAIEAFDRRLPDLLDALDGGVLCITGDHGCDPTTPSTDHTRERTPLLVAGCPGGPYDLGARPTFGDLGATVAALLGVETPGIVGEPFHEALGFGS